MYPLIRKQAERVRDGDGIVVYNFDDTDIPERRGPTKRELDAVMPDRPVLVFHISGHTCYANSKALERIGVNPDAPFDDVNVFLGKDGLPNGYIAEEMAFKAMGELMPALDQERHKALVRECVAEYNAQGFTSAHDSAVGSGNLSAETVYRTYNQLYESGELNMRVYLATMEQPFRRLEPTGLLDGPGNRFVQYSAVKTLADGSIQAGTGISSTPRSGRASSARRTTGTRWSTTGIRGAASFPSTATASGPSKPSSRRWNGRRPAAPARTPGI